MKGIKVGNYIVIVFVVGKFLLVKVDMVLKGDVIMVKLEWVKLSSIIFKVDNVDIVIYIVKVVDVNNNLLENIVVSWCLVQGGGQY